MTVTQDIPPRVPIEPIDPQAPWTPYPSCPDVPIEEILWRIDSKPTQGNRPRARYISYIDARTAAETLDRWVGPDRWEPRYREGTVAGHAALWCDLRIDFPTGLSVVRSDLSTFSMGRSGDKDAKVAMGVKGIVSDAFKRAAATFGVGRNVYRLPEVWASVRMSGDKAYPSDSAVDEILAELRKAGYESNHTPRLDDGPRDDDAGAAPAGETMPQELEHLENQAKLEVLDLIKPDQTARATNEQRLEAIDLWTRCAGLLELSEPYSAEELRMIVELARKRHAETGE